MRSLSENDVSTSTWVDVPAARIRRVASTPSTPGICRSMTTTSGSCSRGDLDRLARRRPPWPTTSMPSAPPSRSASPRRTTAWSSTRTTRTVPGPAGPRSSSGLIASVLGVVGDEPHRGALAGRGGDVEPAAGVGDEAGEPTEPEPRGCHPLLGVEPAPVVGDLEPEPPAVGGDGRPRGGGRRCAAARCAPPPGRPARRGAPSRRTRSRRRRRGRSTAMPRASGGREQVLQGGAERRRRAGPAGRSRP